MITRIIKVSTYGFVDVQFTKMVFRDSTGRNAHKRRHSRTYVRRLIAVVKYARAPVSDTRNVVYLFV